MRKIVSVISAMMLVFILCMYFLLFYAFLIAYFSPSKTVLFCFNEYGEADAEFLLFAIVAPLATYAILHSIRQLINEQKELR